MSVVLVTGASGFVGRHVLACLRTGGVPLRLIARPQRANLLAAACPEAQLLLSPDLFLEDSRWWTTACAGVDTVLHLAWHTEPKSYLTSPLNLTCLKGSLDLAQGALAAGVRRFIGIGTCAEYDLTDGSVYPDSPLRPTNLYAAAKAGLFQTLSQFLPQQGVSFLWARLFYLYGEGEHPDRLVPYLRRELAAGRSVQLSSGRQIRDYLAIEEAASQICELALGEAQGAMNVCSSIATTVREMAERIADEFGRRDLLQYGARPENIFDPHRVVGFNNPSP
jgi:nucleoside-diphosphate-sugar epimerase